MLNEGVHQTYGVIAHDGAARLIGLPIKGERCNILSLYIYTTQHPSSLSKILTTFVNKRLNIFIKTILKTLKKKCG